MAVIILRRPPPGVANQTVSPPAATATASSLVPAVSGGVVFDTGNTGSSITIAATANYLLFANMMVGHTVTGTAMTVTGSHAMTLLGREATNDTVELWGLANPPTGAVSVVRTLSGADPGSAFGCASFKNVVTFPGAGAGVASHGTSASGPAVGGSVFGPSSGVVACGIVCAAAVTTAGGSSTAWNDGGGDAVEYHVGSGGSQTLSYTYTGSVNWGTITIALDSLAPANQTISPPAATASASAIAPIVTNGAIVTAPIATATASAPAPGVSATYHDATGYRPLTTGPFLPLRVVNCATPTDFTNALAGLTAGDLVNVAAMTITGQWTLSASLASTAEIRFASGVNITGLALSSNTPACYLNNPQNVRLFGGDITNPGGGGIQVRDGTNIQWWGFTIHDCGDHGILIRNITAGGTGLDFDGEITNCGLDLSYDPHAEKGTGIHGAEIGGGGTSGVTSGKFSLWVHDQPTGAAMQLGSECHNSEVWVKAERCTFAATSQVAGIALSLWGGNLATIAVHKVTGIDLQDKVVDVDPSLPTGNSAITIEDAESQRTNLNTAHVTGSPFDLDISGSNSVSYTGIVKMTIDPPATASASAKVPTVTASGANQTVSPPAATAAASSIVPVPQLRVLPAAATAAASSPIPSVALGVASPAATASASSLVSVPQLRVAPAAATASASAPVPTVTAATLVSPPAASAAASGPLPAVQLRIPVPLASAAASAPVPIVTSAPVVSAPAATAAASSLVAAVQLQVPAPAATASASGLVPGVFGGQTVSPPAATASASAPVPAIQVQVPVPVASASASAPVPVVTSAILVLPPAATSSASALIPAVKLQIAALVASASASAPLPLFGVTIILPAATASATGKLPALQLNIAAPSTTAAAAAVAPFVTAGALVIVTAPFRTNPQLGVTESASGTGFRDRPLVGATSSPTVIVHVDTLFPSDTLEPSDTLVMT